MDALNPRVTILPRPRRSDRVTIQSVASRAGVSVMTVSNVVRKLPVVRPETRDRVLSAIDELGYVPNQAARRLNGAIASRIGLVYFDHDLALMDAALASISIAAAERGLQLILRKAPGAGPLELNEDSLPDLLDSLIRADVEGLLLLTPIPEILSKSHLLDTLTLPVAAIQTATALRGISTFRIDNRLASRCITQSVILGGHKRIAVVTGPMSLALSQERFSGFLDALQENGLSLRSDWVREGAFTFDSGLKAGEHLLAGSHKPDAIVAANDDMAAGLITMAHRKGVAIPEDLAVVGFDNSLISTRLWPPLSTVGQPLEEMVSQALDWLGSAIRDSSNRTCDKVLDFKIILRGSSLSSLDDKKREKL